LFDGRGLHEQFPSAKNGKRGESQQWITNDVTQSKQCSLYEGGPSKATKSQSAVLADLKHEQLTVSACLAKLKLSSVMSHANGNICLLPQLVTRLKWPLGATV
jgi:hypothetical protein